MFSRKKIIRVGVVASLAIASLGVVKPVSAAKPQVGPKRSVTATIKGGQNLTVLLVSGTGRTLASRVITRATQKITLATPALSTTAGMNLQLVNSAGAAKGEYFGPVVLGWSGKTSAKASRVFMRLKKTTAKKISLGTLTIKKVGASKKQGYAVASKQVAAVSKVAATGASAVRGRPLGVGGYGKSATASAKSVSAMGFVSTPQPPNPPQGPPNPPQGPPNPQQGGQPQGPPNPQQGGQPQGGQAQNAEGKVEVDDNTFGGDKDKDGIPNAFDVDDDGDGTLDAADAETPTPMVSADDGVKDCGAFRWNIFTNFKATGENFQGTINAYGSGNFEATPTAIASTIEKTMTMVFQPITQVCGSPVKASYIKGNGVPYAPTDFVAMGRTCNTGDFQWLIGKGRMCSTDAQGYDFGSAYTFSPTDLPSGQDTFTMKVETEAGQSYEFTASPGFVFVTHPMLKSYNTGSGEQVVNYGAPSIPRIVITSGSELTLTMYRPQRLAFDGEAGQFYDLGGFRYTPDIPNGVNNGTDRPGKCDANTITDSVLTADAVIDKTASPTVTIKWKIGQCFSAKNIPWTNGTLNVDVQVEPTGPGGNSAQKLFLTTS
jgi:hypothetical protein